MTATDISFSPLTHPNIHTVHEYGVKFGIVSSGATKAFDKNQIASTKDKFALKTNTEKYKKSKRDESRLFNSEVYKNIHSRKCFLFYCCSFHLINISEFICSSFALRHELKPDDHILQHDLRMIQKAYCASVLSHVTNVCI